MTTDEKMQALGERIQPHLSEMGIEAFVLVGYIQVDGEGRQVARAVCQGNTGNVAYVDGLRPVLKAAALWGVGELE